MIHSFCLVKKHTEGVAKWKENHGWKSEMTDKKG